MNREKEIEAYMKGRLSQEENLKYEVARESGVLDQVLEDGWRSLPAKVTGRIGGIMARKKKEQDLTK